MPTIETNNVIDATERFQPKQAANSLGDAGATKVDSNFKPDIEGIIEELASSREEADYMRHQWEKMLDE